MKQATKYASYFFAQGDDADEPIETLDKLGAELFIDYLDGAGCEPALVYDGPGLPWGENDELLYAGNYVIGVNRGLPYIGVHVAVKP